MGRIWITCSKELRSYFFSPVGWVAAVIYYFFRSFDVASLSGQFTGLGQDVEVFSIQYTFLTSNFLLILLVPPLLTMRTFAEEKRTGSLEVLLTAPVRDVEVVVGKWLAALMFFAGLFVPGLLVMLVFPGDPFLAVDLPLGPVLAGHLGLFLLGALLISVGVFFSALTENLLLAALASLITNMAVFNLPGYFTADMFRYIRENQWALVLFETVNIQDHLQFWFSRGLIDTSKVMFYVSGTVFFLFLTIKSLETRKWRG